MAIVVPQLPLGVERPHEKIFPDESELGSRSLTQQIQDLSQQDQVALVQVSQKCAGSEGVGHFWQYTRHI